MLLSKLLWFLAVSGVSVRELKLTAAESISTEIDRRNGSLHWTTDIRYDNGEGFHISCEKTTVDAARSPGMKDVLFNKTEKQATATPSSKMPPGYTGIVKILPPATLFIQRVDLSDEGFYKCEIFPPARTAFRRIRKAINFDLKGLIKLVHEVTIPYSSSRQVQVDVQCKAEGYRYRCEAKNWVGQDDTAKFEIKVYYSPKIIKPLPEDQIVDENGQVSVRCEAEGYPPPKITWIKLLGNQKVQEGNSMNISDVQRSDHGRYRCVASNGFGQDATAEFKITVYCYGSEHKFTTGKPSSDPSTRTILFIVLGSLAGLITMAVLIKFWIGRRHKPPASLRLPPDIDENDFKFDVFVTYSS